MLSWLFDGYHRSGKAESNAETVLSFEPQIMLKMNYQLTVHSPFRPFEGHLLEMKTRSLLGFDLEQVRVHADDFFRVSLLLSISLNLWLVSVIFFEGSI